MKIREKWGVIVNGCSSSPDFNFQHCCDTHDYHYAVHDITRAEADKKLRKCIQKEWHGILLPWIYWGAVRMFGGKHYK